MHNRRMRVAAAVAVLAVGAIAQDDDKVRSTSALSPALWKPELLWFRAGWRAAAAARSSRAPPCSASALL